MASPSTIGKIIQLLRSPKGRQAVAQAQRLANQPQVRRQAIKLLSRVFGTRR